MDEQPFRLNFAETPKRLTSDVLADLKKVYGRGGRAIRWWWKEGAPIFDPAAMPAWWAVNKTWDCPIEIQRAAAVHAPAAAPLSSPGVSADPQVAVSGVVSEESVILGSFQMGEGEGVVMQRQIVAAAYEKLKSAYETGTNIDLMQKRYNGAAEALRKLEISDRAAQKQMGNLIPRLVVRTEIGAAVELLRQMRESMARKVTELVPDLVGPLRDRVVRAILDVREKEDRVFRNLESLKSPADVVDRLAA